MTTNRDATLPRPESTLELPPAATEVLILDANGDLLPDLFGTVASSQTRAFWINRNQGASFDMYTCTFIFERSLLLQGVEALNRGIPSEAQEASDGQSLGKLCSEQSAAFADMDGDCRADLVALSSSPSSRVPVLEVWLNTAAGFVLNRTLPLPLGTIHYTLSDLGIAFFALIGSTAGYTYCLVCIDSQTETAPWTYFWL